VKPLVTFGDPEALVQSYLVSAFAPRAESYKPATIGTGFPASALTKTPFRSHVQVELEAGSVADYPVTERAQVRVNCWVPDGERSKAKALASLTMGLLHRAAFDGAAGCVVTTGRSDVIEDPATGYLMCWFLVRVNLTATVLAS
jgi:hypothetical protein